MPELMPDFAGMELIHVRNFTELLVRFFLNMAIVFVMVRMLYYPVNRRKNYLFSFILISALVFLLCFLLENVKLQLGFAFGLFAIFGILRYRTSAIPIKEMTYLFILIGISVINALANRKISWAELIFTNFSLLFLVYGFEKLWLLRHESTKQIIFERSDLIRPENRAELKKELELRTGIKINRIEIGRIDYLHHTVRINIYYSDKDNPLNRADEGNDSEDSLIGMDD
jgi:hypothetical protein